MRWKREKRRKRKKTREEKKRQEGLLTPSEPTFMRINKRVLVICCIFCVFFCFEEVYCFFSLLLSMKFFKLFTTFSVFSMFTNSNSLNTLRGFLPVSFRMFALGGNLTRFFYHVLELYNLFWHNFLLFPFESRPYRLLFAGVFFSSSLG